MAAHEVINYDPTDEHYSDVVLTIRILMGKVNKNIYVILIKTFICNTYYLFVSEGNPSTNRRIWRSCTRS